MHENPAPETLSLEDYWEIIQARWKHFGGRQRWVAVAGAAFFLTGLGLAFADILAAGILFPLLFDLGLVAIGLGALVWITFQLNILTKTRRETPPHHSETASPDFSSGQQNKISSEKKSPKRDNS